MGLMLSGPQWSGVEPELIRGLGWKSPQSCGEETVSVLPPPSQEVNWYRPSRTKLTTPVSDWKWAGGMILWRPRELPHTGQLLSGW